jgi:hypothetical protein
MSATISRRSLAADFAPAPAPSGSHATRLLDALPPRTREHPGEPEPPAEPQIPATAPADVARPSSADDVVRGVAVYLPPSLLDRLRRHARAEDLTYADVLVRAAANHIDTIAARFARPPAPTTGGMPARNRPPKPTPGVQTQLRLDGHQIAWLETAARRAGAPSRTALVVALLQEELPL